MEVKKRINRIKVSEDCSKESENIKATIKTLESILEASEVKVISLEEQHQKQKVTPPL